MKRRIGIETQGPRKDVQLCSEQRRQKTWRCYQASGTSHCVYVCVCGVWVRIKDIGSTFAGTPRAVPSESSVGVASPRGPAIIPIVHHWHLFKAPTMRTSSPAWQDADSPPYAEYFKYRRGIFYLPLSSVGRWKEERQDCEIRQAFLAFWVCVCYADETVGGNVTVLAAWSGPNFIILALLVTT